MCSCQFPVGWHARNSVCRDAFYVGAHRLQRLRRSHTRSGSMQAARQSRKRGIAAPQALFSRLKSLLETGSAAVQSKAKVSLLLTLISEAKLGAPCHSLLADSAHKVPDRVNSRLCKASSTLQPGSTLAHL